MQTAGTDKIETGVEGARLPYTDVGGVGYHGGSLR